MERVREMTKARGIGVLFLLAAAWLWLGGCASGPPLKTIPVTEKNPVEQLTHLENDIVTARSNGLDVMAPTRFAKVEKYFTAARDAMGREAELSDILLKISEARAHLQLAEESAQIATSALGSAIQARELARQAGAASLGDDYLGAERRFLKLTRAIEKDNLRWAQHNEVKVARAFDQLELRAIKEKALGEARTLLAKARRENAESLTPTTWLRARTRMEAAEDYIAQNRYQAETIAEHTRETLFEARRLNRVLEQSIKLKEMTTEEAALWMEGFLGRAAEALGAPDRRDEDFDMQAASILGLIATWQGEYETLAGHLDEQTAEIAGKQAKIAELEGRSQEEQAERDRLAAERRFQALFNEARAFFTPGEAEIYQQGNTLVIRLRSIRFPVGQAVILPDNYVLLGKVQQAIALFGRPGVTIEGHSDSTGRESANLELSQKRADAVRQYLAANRTLPADNLSAVGFGSARPLATNQTAEGRAINRRIDLILTPEATGR
jgi:outer membrane protein OmpA-like peptidoglycan-associated protein